MGNADTPLKGFHWRGGAERNTTGILMWSEPFEVNLPSGEKVRHMLDYSMYVCICVCVNIHSHTRIYTHTSIIAYIYIYTYIHNYTYTCRVTLQVGVETQKYCNANSVKRPSIH